MERLEEVERYMKALEALLPEIPDYLIQDLGTLIFNPEELV